MEKSLTINEFVQKLNSEDSRKAHLADQKWGGGFTCHRCGSTHFVKRRTRHHSRCGFCRFDESVTSNTLFHKIRSPLPSTFAMVDLLAITKTPMSSCKLARQLNVHEELAWFFKRKVQLAIEICETGIQLTENVEANETFAGSREERKRGRCKGNKRRALVSIEIDYSEITRKIGKLMMCRATIIENASGQTLKQTLDVTVEATADVTTNGCKGYLSALVDNWHNIKESAQGANFEALHWHIFNLKNWVRGIHNHISRDHLQSYLHEFNFTLNN